MRCRRVGCVALVRALGYGGVLAWFRINEDRYVFQPERGPLQPPPARLALDSRDVRFRRTTGWSWWRG